MKKYLFILFMIWYIGIMGVAQDNWGYGLLSLFIVYLPNILPYILLIKKEKEDKNKINIELSQILKTCLYITIIVFLCLMFWKALNQNNEEQIMIINSIFYYTIYFSILISQLFVINYLVVPSAIVRKNVINFSSAILLFIKTNYLMSLLCLLFCIFLNQINNELFFALIGGYIFYVLTTINDKYQNLKKENDNDKYSRGDIVIQTIVSLLIIILVFCDFERLFDFYTNNSDLDLTYIYSIIKNQLLFLICSLFIYYKDNILNNINKLKNLTIKNKKRPI